MRQIIFGLTLLFVLLTLIGCNASKTVIKKPVVASTESETQLEIPTPDDQMALVKRRLNEEMRIFDVGAHHDALYAEISILDKGLTDLEIKAALSKIVKDYMDTYFLDKTGEILSEYNENYTLSDVNTLFESTSRKSLYTLIELYEWSFYTKKR